MTVTCSVSHGGAGGGGELTRGADGNIGPQPWDHAGPGGCGLLTPSSLQPLIESRLSLLEL